MGLFSGSMLSFVAIVLVLWLLFQRVARNEELKQINDFNSRLLDRVGSGKDFLDFLQSDGGMKFMEVLKARQAGVPLGSSNTPRHAILRTMQMGIVLLSLGIGLIVFAHSIKDSNIQLLSAVALSLGIGFLISTAASYRLGKSLGVFDDTRPRA